jgi:hypothetical protein
LASIARYCSTTRWRENADRGLLLGAVLVSWPAGDARFDVGWGALAIVGACLAWGIGTPQT